MRPASGAMICRVTGLGVSWLSSGLGSARVPRVALRLHPLRLVLFSGSAPPRPQVPSTPRLLPRGWRRPGTSESAACDAALQTTLPQRGEPWGPRALELLAHPRPRNCFANRPTAESLLFISYLYRHFWELVVCQTLEGNARGLGSQLKDSIPVTELSASGPFESHDLLRKGLPCVKNELLPSHPLELSEKNFQLNQDKMNFSTLRNIQGLFAPLKLQMEFKAVQQAQRLPFLPSSNLSLDILRGNDETIGFEDILNDPSQSELMGEPHLMVEYKLGLL
uniref:Proteasome maturation protein n=1 Tax=Felis catus TaxID=9685 RepID=A0ABI7Z7L1_FELCA